MVKKLAILENENVLKFLNNSRDVVNQVRSYMPLAFGMHCENMRRLVAMENQKGKRVADFITPKGLLVYRRAKNEKPRRELIPQEQAEIIFKVVKRGKLKIDNRSYERIYAEQGADIEEYHTHPMSLWTLRHTFILNLVRKYKYNPDRIDLITQKAGCTRNVVVQNYLDLEQWEEINKVENSTPYDLSKFKFMEY